MTPKPAAKNMIEAVVEHHARAVVQKLSDKEVLESLRQQGISSLEDLVHKSLEGFKTGGASGGIVARDTFIYTQAIYKIAMPIDQGLVDEMSKSIGR